MRSWLAALVFTFAALTSGSARATVGGPSRIEVLGLAQAEGKLFYLEHSDDSSDDPPELYFMRTDGPHAGRSFRVRSWHRGFADRTEPAAVADFERRLARLRKRLRTVLELATSDFDVEQRVIATTRGVDAYDVYGERDEHEREVTVEHVDSGRRTEAHSFTCYDASEVELGAAFEFPDGETQIVIAKCISIPFETGYEVDELLLVPPAS